MFNPYELAPSITPAKICEFLTNKEYSAAISAVVSLNLPLRKVLKKIPISHVKQTIQELSIDKLNIVLIKLAENSIDYR